MADNPEYDATVRHSIYIERHKASVAKKIVAMVSDVTNDLYKEVAVSDLEGLTRRQLDRLLRDVESAIRTGYGPITDAVEAALRDFSVYEAEWQAGMLDRTGVVADLGIPSDADLWAAVTARPFEGKYLQGWLDGLPENTVNRVKDTIRQGYVDGRGALDVARDLRGTRSRKGVMDISKRGAEMMVRTAMASTANVARERSYQSSRVIQKVQWASVLDHRTTAVCFPAETKVIPAGDVVASFKRQYRGDMLTIATASGNKVRCTPNHPILTPRGWLAAAKLKECDQIVKADVANVRGIRGSDNVGVEASIGAIYDAVSQPAVSTIKTESSSPAQFHGDGMAGDYKVNIAAVNGVLGDWIKSVADKPVKESLLHGSHFFRSMPSSDTLLDHIVSWLPPVDTAEVTVRSIQDAVKPTLTADPAKLSQDFGGPCAAVEHINGPLSVADAFDTLEAAGRDVPDAGLGEEIGDGSSGGIESPPDAGDAFPFPVSFDDVVSIGREFVSCHVYNLHTHLGYYIAGGVIVKNCQARDGTIYDKNKGPRPPAHVGCRSTIIPITRTNEAAMRERETYQEWLGRQSAKTQDDILGPSRGKLYRDGGYSVDRFVDKSGQEYTLDELRAKDKEAFDEVFNAE